MAPAFVVAGYNELIRKVPTAFPGSEANVVPVPYDFRQGVLITLGTRTGVPRKPSTGW